MFSYSRPRENIFSYNPWLLQFPDGSQKSYSLEQWKRQGKGLIAKLGGVDDRDAAQTLINNEIAIKREELPVLGEGEYYWFDLLKKEVVNTEGKVFGQVVEIKETGANDVLVVDGTERHLIPFLKEGVIKSVDHDSNSILVDWDGGYI